MLNFFPCVYIMSQRLRSFTMLRTVCYAIHKDEFVCLAAQTHWCDISVFSEDKS